MRVRSGPLLMLPASNFPSNSIMSGLNSGVYGLMTIASEFPGTEPALRLFL